MKCLRNKRDILENILLPLWAGPFDRKTNPPVVGQEWVDGLLPKSRS
jgi:hypothetical protein